MKTNVEILKEMARLGAIDTEIVKYEGEDDIIIKDYDDTKKKLILDNINDEDLPLLISIEQLRTLKSIKGFVKATFIFWIAGGAIWLLSFLINLGWKM